MTAHTADKDWNLAAGLAGEFDRIPFSLRTSISDACRHQMHTKGRMWRGRLLLVSACQGPIRDKAAIRNAAIAIELLHLATLAHDDVIDNGALRRGEASMNVLFGPRVAGFAGMAIFARSVEMIAGCGASSLSRFAATSRLMCEGGLVELRQLDDPAKNVDQYLDAAVRKTASAFELAATLGCELSDASFETIKRAGSIGRRFGLAYQVWDDLIDIVAPSSYSGKGRFADLRQGLLTLPILFAIEERPDICELIDGFRNGLVGEPELQHEIDATSAIQRSRRFANDLIGEARTEALQLPRAPELIEFISEANLYHAKALDKDRL